VHVTAKASDRGLRDVGAGKKGGKRIKWKAKHAKALVSPTAHLHTAGQQAGTAQEGQVTHSHIYTSAQPMSSRSTAAFAALTPSSPLLAVPTGDRLPQMRRPCEDFLPSVPSAQVST